MDLVAGAASERRAVARGQRADELRDEGRQGEGGGGLAGHVGRLASGLLGLGGGFLGLRDRVGDALFGVGLADAGLGGDDIGT